MRAIFSHSTLAGFAARVAGFAATLVAGAAFAAAPGITGDQVSPATFNLVAAEGNISQPDGASIYSWGYGCNGTTGFAPATITGTCPTGQMQLPGPTLIVTEGQTVTVNLTNRLPAAVGNTSILFPGFDVTATGGAPGLLTAEATAAGGTVSYSFPTTGKAGTHSYFSGTQGDLQVEMGLYGALIVLPSSIPTNCGTSSTQTPVYKAAYVATHGNPTVPPDFRLAAAAFNHPGACYDREYLFQFSEIDPRIHAAALAQVQADAAKPAAQRCAQTAGCLVIDTEPYHAVYFLINGRSAPDIGDPNYSPQYPLQPYNGNPHMHPGELVLARIIGQGRLQHPFHEHGNHLRVLARDGNMLVNAKGNLAGPLLFTTTTTPGQTIDALFQWTAKGLNWDVYAHTVSGTGSATCTPDANGYHNVPADNHFYEWCADHTKALESKPFGTVAAGGPVTLPDPNILANGPWYSGSPYFGPDATGRAVGPTPIPPFGTIANDPGSEAGYAFMWHSHNEREITTNNIFPGGMLMMMLVDPWVFLINEAN
jgi:FtsP/CotA-like multicopper oxidase with cupredoxin domain